MKSILSTALALATALSASAVTNPTASTNAMPPVVATNSNPEAVMNSLFGDDVIAKGKGFTIKRSDLDKIVDGIKSQAAAQQQTISPAEMKMLEGQMLQRLIAIEILSQQANDADKVAGKKKADEQFAALIQRAGSETAFDMQLKAAGISKTDLYNTAVKNSTAMAAMQRQLGVSVTAKEARDFYSTNEADFKMPETIKVRHILFSTTDMTTGAPLSDEAARAKRKQADDVLKRIRAGEDFSKLAAQYSDDTMTKNEGGALPPLSRNQLMRAFGLPFEEAAFMLQTNQTSDVITANSGYHIIQLLDRTPAKTLTLTDKVPSADITIEDYIKDRLTQQKMAQLAPAFIEKIQKQSNVQIVDPELKQAVETASEMSATNAPAAAP